MLASSNSLANKGKEIRLKHINFLDKRRGGKVFEYEDVYKIVPGSHKWKLDVVQHGILGGKWARLGENTPNKVRLEKIEGERLLGRDLARR